MPLQTLLAAVALNGISYSIARTVGLSIGGVVARQLVGSSIRFQCLAYLPLIARCCYGSASVPIRLLSEKLSRAIVQECAIPSIRGRSRSCWCAEW
ncbi:hypothetical protein ACNJYA_08790 [Bradyrhizobium sp. DASA03068]|uniref:hypothetical protein n=1 Tax=Bradyrhizobium sp. BLXBL-01 TaxID=3395915 RepID=UPI003F726E90